MTKQSRETLVKKFETRAIHSGERFDPTTGAVMPPIHLASTFAQTRPGHPISQWEYARTNNPTRDELQKLLANLEEGRFGLCFSSGCAALATLLQSLEPGSHMVMSDDVYGGTHRLVANVFEKWGITYTSCDMTDLVSFHAALKPNTRLIWVETPSNPLLKVVDIEALSKINQQQSTPAILAVDNTFATPYLQTPLTLGADIVCHSTTKYLGGHSDVVGGALILNDESLREKLAYLQNAIGAVPSPFDCYLLIRSIKTLPIRMQAHCDNAKQIATFLNQHPKVEKVYYPGLTSHPQHSLASVQMRDFGGMISLVLKGNIKDALNFLERLEIFTLAESLGGVESLIEHPALMTHAAIPALHRQKIGIEDTFIRISVGIEAAEDLINDLQQALG